MRGVGDQRGRGTVAHCPQTHFFPFALLFYFNCLFIYLWLHWVFVDVHGLSLVGVSANHSLVALFRFHCGGFSCYGAQAAGTRASVVAAQALERAGSVVVSLGFVVLLQVESSWNSDQTHVIGGQILIHPTSRGVPPFPILISLRIPHLGNKVWDE